MTNSLDLDSIRSLACQAAPDVMQLDTVTQRDLEVFASPSGGKTLLEFCDYTRTSGGNKALIRRLQQPWSSAEKILQSQQAIFFVAKNLALFQNLPSSFLLRRVEMYHQEILPIVEHDNLVEFTIEAISIWASNIRHYLRIVYGVQMCRRLIHTLNAFTSIPELQQAPCELEPLLAEMKAILKREGLAQLPDIQASMSVFKTFRTDRVFRVHEVSSTLRLMDIIFEIDALVALAETTVKHKLTRPQLLDGELSIRAQGLVHPYLANAIANPLTLSQNARGLFLTGPNMAGKTTYMRAFAMAVYFAHLGMGVAASEFKFTPIKGFYSSITLSDNLNLGVSYFRAEALRVKQIAAAVVSGEKVVAILDEPFKGTNVKDTLEASLAILKRFSAKSNCLFIFFFSPNRVK